MSVLSSLAPETSTEATKYRDSGSAAAEFVLMVAPMGLLFFALLSFVCAGIAQQASVTLAVRAAETCGLRDATQEDVQQLTKSWAPRFITVRQVTCSRAEDWAEVSLYTNFVSPLSFVQSEVTWHATSENF